MESSAAHHLSLHIRWQVQSTIGQSDYVRRDMALKHLIQPLAGEYGMHNGEQQGALAVGMSRAIARMTTQCCTSGLVAQIPSWVSIIWYSCDSCLA